MFEVLIGNKEDAIAILKRDHAKVKDLFNQFEDAQDLRTKKRIAAEAIKELKIHAEIEEKIFYPSVRRDVEKDIMNEADEEHHVAKLLIAELGQMNGSEEHWEAKFMVLAENIRHHIREEEGEMLPQLHEKDGDLQVLGRKLLAMKQQLKKNGIPPSDEEKLMARGLADSPAKATRRAQPAKLRARKSSKTSKGAIGVRAKPMAKRHKAN